MTPPWCDPDAGTPSRISMTHSPLHPIPAFPIMSVCHPGLPRFPVGLPFPRPWSTGQGVASSNHAWMEETSRSLAWPPPSNVGSPELSLPWSLAPHTPLPPERALGRGQTGVTGHDCQHRVPGDEHLLCAGVPPTSLSPCTRVLGAGSESQTRELQKRRKEGRWGQAQ